MTVTVHGVVLALGALFVLRSLYETFRGSREHAKSLISLLVTVLVVAVWLTLTEPPKWAAIAGAFAFYHWMLNELDKEGA